jgi:hypothetical protein
MESFRKIKSWSSPCVLEGKPLKIDWAKVVTDFRGVGDRFTYLGVEMIVTGHVRLVGAGRRLRYSPALMADYVDNNGIVRHLSFDPVEISLLKKENEEK